jgi:peptidoglycan/xylan/chitin deacetylase (PgdA/CDA1 family)
MRPTIIITFDDPELETGFMADKGNKGFGVFSLFAFEGKVGFYKESFYMLKSRAFPMNIVYFFVYIFLAILTLFVRLPTIFDLLNMYKIKATFFGIISNLDTINRGKNKLRYNPDIFKKIINEGHELGYHGYLHNSLNQEDIDKSRKIAKKVLGTELVTYSTPWGEDKQEYLEVLKKKGFIGWRTWKFESNLKSKPVLLKYTPKMDLKMFESVKNENKVIAINLHTFPDMYPFNYFRLRSFFKRINELNMESMTFKDFCFTKKNS